MTEGGRRFCRFMSVAVLFTAALSAQSFGASASDSDANAVRRAELSHWRCTPASTESCSIKVRTIAVAAPYALVDWVTLHSGGQSLYRKKGASWARIATGGGAMDVHDLVHYGVPRAIAAQLVAR